MHAIIIFSIIITISITPVFGEHKSELEGDLGLNDFAWYEECTSAEGYELENCMDSIYYDYVKVFEAYHTLNHNHTETVRTTEHLQDEVNVWHNKYNYVIAQHGVHTIQDQLVNLTERMNTVETKASTNESLIYILQNIVRTVQVDIADIFIKINSVR